ncbi:MAG: carbamoyl-phosphate synthase large subunit [Proteobacteria bacterium]|nr:carbamoyl-phosphate synthase large subunit [Pseudomonadota bacterium]
MVKAIRRLFIANRGEIAIRIARAATEMNITSVACFATDEAESLHVHRADEAVALTTEGVAAYLDVQGMIDAAVAVGCDAIHPGYGFLSENPDLARACVAAGLVFVGPTADQLELFGNKRSALQAAQNAGIPTLASVAGTDRSAIETLLNDGPVIIKALAGGGGRGMRTVNDLQKLDGALTAAKREAAAAFGNGEVFVERYLPRTRHIEVQIVGDGQGGVIHLGERDCSLQRRHQKIVEIAPAPELGHAQRRALFDAALTLARSVNYRSLGTFEFLVDTEPDGPIAFIEANPRLQVEHTITEAVTGIDLVCTQLAIAAGRPLADLNLVYAPRGCAVQLRINMERMSSSGDAVPTGGLITAFEPAAGPGVRVDSFGYAGYATSARYDSLLAKLIVHANGDLQAVLGKAYRALAEFRIDGVQTNREYLQNLLLHPQVTAGKLYTRLIDDAVSELTTAFAHPVLYRRQDLEASAQAVQHDPARSSQSGDPRRSGRAGASLASRDPLAVLQFGQSQNATGLIQSANQGAKTTTPTGLAAPDGTIALAAPLQGTVISLTVQIGESVATGQVVAIMESMKMEHEVRADSSGTVHSLGTNAGETLYEGYPLLYLTPGEVDTRIDVGAEAVDPDYIRPDLAEVLDRQYKARDEYRPEAVAKRHSRGFRTARENVEHLCDPGTFVEYGALVLAAQRRRRSIDDLIEKTAADGMITGVGAINGDLFDEPANRSVVMAYDYMVLAGTQGGQNHRKTDRMIDVAHNGRMPMVLFAEGGGGRPGDTDGIGGEGTRTFARFATLSGLVPMIGITTGRCFAGNASLLGCCDTIIATEKANIGMGGPAMIEGGGLGIYAPEDIGPMSVQVPNGVVDILVKDEAEAVACAKRYLSYFQGSTKTWSENDQRVMRHIVPENRLRVYEIRDIIATIADKDSVLELRAGFGHGMVTALIRVEGRALGVIANNPRHLGGAIDADASDKGARFMQLCDAFDIPLLYLCDTPGIMVGPEIEKTALVRHSSRMFVTGANLSVPFFTIVIRKAYGLGAIAMAGGSYKTPMFTVSWPTGEFGGMGLEGSVKLGYRNDLAAIEDPQERAAKYEQMVARAYETGKALNYGSLFSVDDTIDPKDSRWWLSNLLKSIRLEPRSGKKRPAIDPW